MGFLERLAAIKIEKEKAKQAVADAERKESERQDHEVRKQLALEYRQASGVSLLVQRLGLILSSDMVSVYYGGGTRLTSRGESWGPDYYSKGDRQYSEPFAAPRFRKEDLDSAVDIAVWDRELHKWNQGYNYRSHVTQKFLVAESRPDGLVSFHGSSVNSITREAWKTKPDILEAALEKAFNNPRTHSFEHSSGRLFPPDDHYRGKLGRGQG